MTEPLEHEEAGNGLRHYLDVLRRRQLTVVAVVALSLAAAVLFTLRQTNEYRAETTIVVGQAGGLVQPQNAGAIQPFSATMQELITSTVVAQDVINALNLKTMPQSLLSSISVSFNPQSAALRVSVIESSPILARAVAQQIGVSFTALVKERFGKARSTNPSTAPLSATVWDPAHVIPGKIQPRPKLNLLIAGILGVVLGLLAAFLREQFDRTLRSTDEIERAFGVPVIGQIPSLQKPTDGRPRVLWNGNSDYGEAFKALRANLQYLGVARPLRTVLVTSPVAGQGKTTVCANLATVLAQSGSSVVLVEADLRRPQLGDMFGLPPVSAGLTTFLVGKATLSGVMSEIELPLSAKAGSSSRSVTILPSGPLPPNPSELAGSQKMQQAIT
jgi:succinoglycan biosynthesis transport protein ExoP